MTLPVNIGYLGTLSSYSNRKAEFTSGLRNLVHRTSLLFCAHTYLYRLEHVVWNQISMIGNMAYKAMLMDGRTYEPILQRSGGTGVVGEDNDKSFRLSAHYLRKEGYGSLLACLVLEGQ
ncbi:hypothetical protein IG631_15439 [Alternaria alternata]|nr:hypothetical protein IG631_15439 [Alternaria alternata]